LFNCSRSTVFRAASWVQDILTLFTVSTVSCQRALLI
jgi:hypothetical protein